MCINFLKTSTIRISILVLLPLALTPELQSGPQNTKIDRGTTRFAVSFDKSVRTEPTSGRILLLLSTTEKFRTSTFKADFTPLFGTNVDDLAPGKDAIVDAIVKGYPVRSLKDIPAGTYFVQAYLNIYTTFKRSDGHTVKLHMDQGEGQNWRTSPGNLFSTPKKVHYDPKLGDSISIVMDQVIPPIPEFQETEWVKYLKIKSELLTEFWGHPMYINARVLIPKGFNDHPDARYPLISQVGHFPKGNPGRFEAKPGNALYEAWISDDFARFLLVTYEHPTPYYDDSYGVNSENNGPYGDAFIREVFPRVEQRFRGIGKPYSRLLTGGSTGGWISLAMQVRNPDFFGGTWTFAPDQVDFRYFQQANLYKDDNAYYIIHEWNKVHRPLMRAADGNILLTMEQFNLAETVIGDRYRSGGQMAIFNAVFAPVDTDGYPKPLYDPWTGKIDRETAEWAKEHYDIRYYLEKNWQEVGPKLIDKINIFCGRMDNFYLNEAVYLLEEFLASTSKPHYPGRFEYGDRGGHSWSPWGKRGGRNVNMYREMAAHIIKMAPKGENTAQWNY
jgi:hypothetical protein